MALTEWFINAAEGLEQGVTIDARPAPAGAGPLRLTWQVRGGLQPVVAAAGQALTWTGPDGARALRYDRLVVRDRLGAAVPAHFDVAAARVAVVVDDAHAAYPLTIDPTWSQQAYLKASNTDAGDNFGYAVAVSGDTVVVGAPLEDSSATGGEADNSAANSGAA